MKCPNCGTENRDIARFCQHCGAALTITEPPVVPAESAEDLDAAAAVPALEPPAAEEAPLGGEPLPGPEAYTWEAEADQAAEGGEPVLPAEPWEPVQEVVEVVEQGAELPAGPAAEEAEPLAGSEAPEPTPEALIKEPVVEEEPPGEWVPEAQAGEAEVPPDQPAVSFEETSVDEDQDRESVSGTAGEPASPGVQEVGEELLAAAAPEAPEEGGTEGAADLVPAESPEEPAPAEVGAQGDVQELADAGLLPWEDREEEPVPLELGTVVNGRYQVIEVLSEQGGEVIYRVRDLQRCPQCGFAGNSPDEAFCASCGAALERKPVAMMLERSAEEPGKEIEAQVEDHFAEGGQHYWVWREVTKVASKKEASLAPRLIVGQASDTGRVRALDEDTLFVLIMSCTRESVAYPLGLFVVADGMGGHEAGEVASRVAIQTFATVLMHNVFVPELEGHSLSPEAIRDWMVKAVDAANDRVYLERRKRESDMGTTVTAALVKDWTLHLAHVGDCRAYRWSEEGLKQLTTDHSIVAGMIAAGAAAPEEIYTHPQRSVIYRSVGDRPSVEVDTDVMALNPGDRLILCCDGLWEMVRSEGIEDVMLSESDPQRACDILVEQANQAGGVDNISAIVVQL